MKVLFVTRKHPPSVGGMERLSAHLIDEMRGRVEVRAVVWGGSQRLLPVFVPYALARSVCIALGGVDLVHVGDPVLAPIGWVLRGLFGVPIAVTVHGLDVTFPFWLYQRVVPRLLRRFDRLICISESAFEESVRRGIDADRCRIIHPGVALPCVTDRPNARRWLGQRVDRDLQDVAVLLTVGRLVPRKGVAWFAEWVLPRLLAEGLRVCYVVVGTGSDEGRVRSLAADPRTAGGVRVLGKVPEDDLGRIYAAADLFVMPNLPVPGDMEGFGLVALEAAAHGLPALAADLEGVRDAVVAEKTGRLVRPGDVEAWVRGVSELLRAPDSLARTAELARVTVRERFTWGHMADAYKATFQELVEEQGR